MGAEEIELVEMARVRSEYRAGRPIEVLRTEADSKLRKAEVRVRAVIRVADEIRRAEAQRSGRT